MNPDSNSNGQDSFLDIVANLVGILIILVVIIGAQAATAWQSVSVSDENTEEITDLQSETEKSLNESLSIQSRNAELRNRIEYQQRINRQLMENRHQVLIALEVGKRKLAEKQESMNERKIETERIQANVDFLQQQIEQVKFEFNAVKHIAKTEKKIIEHFPTPIAKTVFADEIHFQLKDNRVAYVPMDELVDAMKSEWQVKAKKLAAAKDTWEIVGPLEQFRLQYLLKVTRNPKSPSQYGIQFKRFVLQPTGADLGETVDEALKSNSRFLSRLRRLSPAKTTVTFWVYPDSFQDFFDLRESLREQGYTTASWPLDFNQPISGGPSGFRTSTN